MKKVEAVSRCSLYRENQAMLKTKLNRFKALRALFDNYRSAYSVGYSEGNAENLPS